jgi:succinoglycan biosynthesis transport protein ExoP
MAVRNADVQEDIDLMSLFGALRRALPKILLWSVLLGALTYGVLSMMAPRYTSETQVAIASKRTNPFPENNQQSGQSDSAPRLDREAINTHVKALTAPELLLRVADELNLGQKAEFNPNVGPVDALDGLLRLVGIGKPPSGMNESDLILDAVSARLQVAAARETRFISIKFSSSDPRLAATFANRLADSYRKSLIDIPVQETNEVVAALIPKIEQLNTEVITAEAELERFRAQTNRLLTGPQQVPLNSQRLSALSAELAAAESARSQAEARWRTAQELLRSGSAEVLPEVQASNTIQGLINQRVRLERQVNEAAAALLPAHPRMRQLNADLRGLRRAVSAEVSKVVQSLEKSYRSAQIRVDTISQQMSALKTQVVNTSGDDARVRVLEAQAKSKRAELDRLRRQLEDNKTLVVTKSVPVEAQIISQARPSSKPTFPRKAPISALVMAATFLLGIALTAAREIVGRGQGAVERAPMPPRGAPGGGGRGRRSTDYVVDDEEDYEPMPAPAPARAVAETPLPAAAPAVARESAKPAKAAPVAAVAGGLAGASSLIASRLGIGKSKTEAAIQEEADDDDDAFDVYEDEEGEEDAVAVATDRLGEIAEHLVGRAEPGVGHRVMVVGENNRIDATHEACELADGIARLERQVILIDCSLDGHGNLAEYGVGNDVGFVDLISGEASFEQVIKQLPDSAVHVVAAGRSLATDEQLDADSANLILDALDEAYDHIVVFSGYEDARTLFEVIQGRFDAGLTVADARRVAGLTEVAENSFVGFEVTDIDVIRFERTGQSAYAMRREELGTAGVGA